MAKIKDPTYECDFCGTKSNQEYDYVFKAAWDNSIHTYSKTFGLCEKCHDKIYDGRVVKALKKLFKIKT